MQIRSKAEFYRLWKAGVLGNRPATFNTAAEAYASGCGIVGIREIGAAGGGKFEIAQRAEIHEKLQQWDAEGRRYSLDGGVRNELVTLQAEVCRSFTGLGGIAAVRSGVNVRAAMAAGLFKPVTAVTIRALMTQFMDASSREDVDALLDLYPDATVEFACFSVNVGVIPNRNTLIWEVRDY